MIDAERIRATHAALLADALAMPEGFSSADWLIMQGFDLDAVESFAFLQARSDPRRCQTVSASAFLFGLAFGYRLGREEQER
jgi:hypothetical protein